MYKQVRQKETVQKQQQVIRDQDNVNAISTRGGKSNKPTYARKPDSKGNKSYEHKHKQDNKYAKPKRFESKNANVADAAVMAE